MKKGHGKKYICSPANLTTDSCPFKILSIVGEGQPSVTLTVQSYVVGTNDRILFTAETKP